MSEKKECLITDSLRIYAESDEILAIEYRDDGEFYSGPTFLCEKQPMMTPKENPVLLKRQNDSALIRFGGHLLRIGYSDPDALRITLDDEPLLAPRSNSGELPPPSDTPKAFLLLDKPRLLLPRYSYKEGFDFDKAQISGYALYVLFADENPKKLRKLYRDLTGPTPLPPFSAFGSWDSRYYKYTEETVHEEIANYEKYGLPLDNFVIDTDWRAAGATQGAGYALNTDCFPDLGRLFQDLADKHLTVMFNDHPEPLINATTLFDPSEIAFRHENLTHYLEEGLSYWWYDRNWICGLISPLKEIAPETFGLYLYHDVASQYNLKHKKAESPSRVLVMGNVDDIHNGLYNGISNSASHRYGVQWTGDTTMDEYSLSREFANMIRAGESLITYVNSDISGHVGDGDDDLYLKWVKFGALSPLYRLHGTNGNKRYRQPWLYGERALSAAKEYDKLRYRLISLLYTLGAQSYFDGLPIVRSLSYLDPSSMAKRLDEALIGEDILIMCESDEPLLKPLSESDYLGKVHARFYVGENLEGQPVFESEYDKVDFNWNESSPDLSVPRERFSAVMEGELASSEEDYVLAIGSDDGCRLYLDDKLIVDSWRSRGFTIDRCLVVPKGQRTRFRIEYFQGAAQAGLILFKGSATPNRLKYLPSGYDWIDLFNGNRYSGGQTVNVGHDFRQMPIFVKGGAIIPITNDALNTFAIDYGEICLHLFPSSESEGKAVIYEDDRSTEAYQHGFYRYSEYFLKEEEGCFIFKIKPAKGHLIADQAPSIRKYLIRLHSSERPVKMALNGKRIDYKMTKQDRAAFVLPYLGPCPDSDTIDVRFEADVLSEHVLEWRFE